jgi:DNA mismatch repair protein MutS2
MLPAAYLDTAGFFMHEIDAHSIAVLEFAKVRELIAALTLSPYGRARVEEIHPLHDRDQIEQLLRQSSQMRDIIRYDEAIPLERMDDVSELVRRAGIEGSRLDPKPLLQVKLFLDIISDLAGYGKSPERREKFPDVIDIIRRLHPKREIATSIGRAIDSSGEVVDRASSTLARIRREIGDTEVRLKQQLNKILSARKRHSGWQDDVITLRDGRFVVPVLAGEFGQDEGIIHDKSQSGATLYVEPTSVIPANNRLRQLQQDERQEIDRILKELTAMVGMAAADILADIDTYGQIDTIHARAAFALKTASHSPAIDDHATLSLIDARHPLLIYASGATDGVVPLSLTLDKENQGILITGPNTGGKTVALKTVGLLTVMAMSGLEIPADHKSVIGIYRKIFADIGDEQSIELSLSTFSSHIRNIITAVRAADDRTLILFDEVGAGTDPKEGAALAEVIILALLDRGSNLVATTHYSQLKTLPLEHPSLVNASLEFDRENLQPTFRLKIGHPGASYAIDIARRLGLPNELADKAAVLLGSDERSLDTLIEKLDSDLEHLTAEKSELQERLQRARMLEELQQSQKEQLDQRDKEAKRQFVDQYEKQLRDGKKEIDDLIREIRTSQADSKKIKESRHTIEQRASEIGKLKETVNPKKVADGRKLAKGDIVWIEKLNSDGQVVEMVGNKKVKVAIGSAFITVDTIDVTRKDDVKAAPKRQSGSGAVRASAADGEFSQEIMLRGMTVEEAIESLDKYLDSAVIAGVGQVYIIHGKGTGTLRKRVSAYLKAHPAVESIRIGDWNEGGHGVTIARIKS